MEIKELHTALTRAIEKGNFVLAKRIEKQIADAEKQAAQPRVQADKCPTCAGDGYVTNMLDGKENCIACNATGIRR